jgi:hypothetical protein
MPYRKMPRRRPERKLSAPQAPQSRPHHWYPYDWYPYDWYDYDCDYDYYPYYEYGLEGSAPHSKKPQRPKAAYDINMESPELQQAYKQGFLDGWMACMNMMYYSSDTTDYEYESDSEKPTSKLAPKPVIKTEEVSE